jgi:hypothetical protein
MPGHMLMLADRPKLSPPGAAFLARAGKPGSSSEDHFQELTMREGEGHEKIIIVSGIQWKH